MILPALLRAGERAMELINVTMLLTGTHGIAAGAPAIEPSRPRRHRFRERPRASQHRRRSDARHSRHRSL